MNKSEKSDKWTQMTMMSMSVLLFALSVIKLIMGANIAGMELMSLSKEGPLSRY